MYINRNIHKYMKMRLKETGVKGDQFYAFSDLNCT